MTDGQGTKSDLKSSPCHYMTGELKKQKGPWALDRSSESLTRRWIKTDHKSSPSHYVTGGLMHSTHKNSNSDLVIIDAMRHCTPLDEGRLNRLPESRFIQERLSKFKDFSRTSQRLSYCFQGLKT